MKFEKLNDVEFYVLENNPHKIFAEFPVMSEADSKSDIMKLVDVDSAAFKSYLRLIVLPELDEDVSANEFVQYIKDYFFLYGNDDIISVKVRTAGTLKAGIVEYALYNKPHEFIQITKDGYRIVQKSVHKFIQQDTNASQIYPIHTTQNLFQLLSAYVSATKDMLILFVVWLVQSFCEGNHSALLIMADAGCGKSTITKFVRRILDPSRLGANFMSNKTENLLTTLTNSYVVAFDNATEMSKMESDILCVAVTGGTYAKREAYTTNELAIYDLHNTIIINGINIIPSQSDFAQRCLCLQLRQIEEHDRTTESELEAKFNNDLPQILGSIFDTISKAIPIAEKLNPKRKPRMVDSYIEMLAIAEALDVSEEAFERIYFANIDLMSKLRANTDLVFAVKEYMNKQVQGRSCEGTVSEMYSKIRSHYSGNKFALPNSAAHFSQKLKSEYAALLAAGYVLNVDDTHADGTYVKIIKRKK